jgi:hypothetical protein
MATPPLYLTNPINFMLYQDGTNYSEEFVPPKTFRPGGAGSVTLARRGSPGA